MPRYNGRSKYYKRLQIFLKYRRVFGEKVIKTKRGGLYEIQGN